MQLEEFQAAAKPVTSADKSLFEKYMRDYPSDICVYTFPFMLLWSVTRHHSYGEIDGHLVISYRSANGEECFYAPIGPNPAKIIREILPPSQGYSWKYINEALAKDLETSFTLAWERDFFDYVYRVEDIATLKGKAYAEKRTFINRCRALRPNILKLSSAMKDECMALHQRWVETQPDPNTPSIIEERRTLLSTMEQFEELGFGGIGIQIQGRLEALATWYPIHSKMVVEDFEKASANIPGLYQLLLHELAKAVPRQYEFLNREADLGIPGLRTAKQRWNPVYLVKRFFIVKA